MMGSDEPGVYIMSDLYEIEASSAVAPHGHLENLTLNFVRQLDIGCRWVLGFWNLLEMKVRIVLAGRSRLGLQSFRSQRSVKSQSPKPENCTRSACLSFLSEHHHSKSLISGRIIVER